MTNGRVKGNAFENAICFALSRWLASKQTPKRAKVYDLPFRRRSTSIMPMVGHWDGQGDILHKPGIESPFCIECKKQEGWELDGMLYADKWPVWKWWEQCRRQAAKVRLSPLLIFNRNRRPIYAMLLGVDALCLEPRPKHGPVLVVERPGSLGTVMVLRLDDLVRVPAHKVIQELGPGVATNS